MSLKGFYQNAYVTHDIEAAMQRINARFGLSDGDYMRYDPEMTIITPDGEKVSKVRVALAWAGHMQIELIQPVDGHCDHYRDFLPEDPTDPSPRFHHIAVRRDDLDAMRREIAGLDLPLTFEGSVPGAMVFVYLDARKELGHYIEYVWANAAGWAMNAWPETLTAF